MKLLILILGLIWQDTPSKVLIKISDYEGEKTSAKIEIYQDDKLLISEEKQEVYQTELPQGKYKLKIIACDTITVPIKIWNKEHEYQISVKTDCQ